MLSLHLFCRIFPAGFRTIDWKIHVKPRNHMLQTRIFNIIFQIRKNYLFLLEIS